ncbi:MAG TPA: hypothetical protein PKI22_06075 [Hydrogenophilus thermoluteolus]|nr:hypothetical protein [Hydrogenophilus thermoluteolus]HNU20602.1 hypothetical protein [Hydrogenophilus thermoluteolus]
MPIKPPSLTIRCPKCGWQQTWQPSSDALTPTDLPPERCPRCQNTELLARSATTTETLWARLKDAFMPK